MTATPPLVLSTSGGRLGARRSPVRTIALVLAALIAAAPSATAQPAAADVTVREQGGLYVVTASFSVAQSQARVLAVLTDYEGIPRLVPDVKRSIVRSRTGDRAVVDQEAVSRVLFFSKTVRLRLDIQEAADAVAFRDICGQSFVVYEGAWRVTATPDGSTVTYELRAQPAFDVPEFLIRRLMKRDAGQLIARLRAAM